MSGKLLIPKSVCNTREFAAICQFDTRQHRFCSLQIPFTHRQLSTRPRGRRCCPYFPITRKQMKRSRTPGAREIRSFSAFELHGLVQGVVVREIFNPLFLVTTTAFDVLTVTQPTENDGSHDSECVAVILPSEEGSSGAGGQRPTSGRSINMCESNIQLHFLIANE